MDEALKAAWRAAQASPRDAGARSAYGQALLRAGLRLAGGLEVARALHLEPGRVGGPDGEVELELRAGLREALTRWRVLGDERPADLPDPTPPLVDARLGHVPLARRPSGHAPYALLPWPECPGCQGGLVVTPCARCDGRGEFIEFTGRAEERHPCDACGGTGNVELACCGGRNLVPRRGRPERCDHEALGAPIVGLLDDSIGDLGDFTLHRCQACGLCVLREPNGDEHPACAGCGTFACDGTCDESPARATGFDP